MKKLKRSRRPRGWIMVAVIFILLALSLAVTAFYTQAEDHQYLGTSMNAYSLAAARAEAGAQEALSRVRSGALAVDPLNTVGITCNGGNVWTAACTNKLTSGGIVVGTGADVRTGGGLQYQWVVYKPDDLGAPANLYAIRAIGYVGNSVDSPNLYTSEVELMVQKGDTSSSLMPKDSYDNVVMN